MTYKRIDGYDFHEYNTNEYEEVCDEFEWYIPETVNIAKYVCDRHAARGANQGLIYEDTRGREDSYTFQEMAQLTNRLANYLVDQGVTPGDRVAVCVPQKPETALSHIAIWKTGAVSVPLSVLFGPDALEYRINDCEARFLIADEVNIDAIRQTRPETTIEETILVGETPTVTDETSFDAAIDVGESTFEIADTHPDDNAIILYTSGTTGNPKGVLHTHDMLFGHLPGFMFMFCNAELTDEDVFWIPADWAWMGALFDLVFPALYYGKPVLAYEEYGEFNPTHAYELIEKHRLTNLYIPPTALRMMQNENEIPSDHYDLESVRVLGSGGEALGETLPKWVSDEFGAVVHEGYGQTEATPIIVNCTHFFEYRHNIGKPAPGMEVTILDIDERTPLPLGEVGEIAIAADHPTVFKEYWNDSAKTAAKFVDRWMVTEDLGWKDEDGYFHFKSRKDDVIISSGYRIGPEEIEDTVANHEAVADVGVVGVPDEERGTVAKAFVTLKDGFSPSENLMNNIQSFVKEHLAQYEYPRQIEFVDELPKTVTGKIRRTELRENDATEST
jgi:acetyl-CoA synthetase